MAKQIGRSGEENFAIDMLLHVRANYGFSSSVATLSNVIAD